MHGHRVADLPHAIVGPQRSEFRKIAAVHRIIEAWDQGSDRGFIIGHHCSLSHRLHAIIDFILP
jgi:hypothetical protein